MQFHRPTRKPDSEERVLPLINVVFLLLIFFMLAGRLSEAELFEVVPPESAGAGEVAPPKPDEPREIVLLLAADGRLALDGEILDPAQLTAALAARRAGRPELPVTLKADGAAEALAVVAAMESLRAAGLREIRLLAQAPQETGARP